MLKNGDRAGASKLQAGSYTMPLHIGGDITMILPHKYESRDCQEIIFGRKLAGFIVMPPEAHT